MEFLTPESDFEIHVLQYKDVSNSNPDLGPLNAFGSASKSPPESLYGHNVYPTIEEEK